MGKSLEYKVVTAVSSHAPEKNLAFERLERLVNEEIKNGWRPLGGVSIAAIVGPKALRWDKDEWWLHVAQAMARETEA